MVDPLYEMQDSQDVSLVLAKLKDIKQEMSELKDIKQQMVKLDKIEMTTTSLAEQLLTAINKTNKIETAVSSNTAKLKKVDEDLTKIKATVKKQGESLSNIADFTEDIKTTKAQVNNLADIQKQPAETLDSNTKSMKEEILREVDRRVNKIKQEVHCQALKDQAFNTRHNLVIKGLEENKEKDTLTLVREFVSNTLGVKNVTVNAAHRIGPQPGEDSTYARSLNLITLFTEILYGKTGSILQEMIVTRKFAFRQTCPEH